MSLENFLMENVEIAENEKVVLSDRFKDPFEIRAISEAENTAIKKSCRNRIKQKYGQSLTETDHDLYLVRLAVACTVEPDFKNAGLQKSWGVMGEEMLIQKMLLPGEFAELVNRIQEICGFDIELEEAKEEVKKPTGKETENCNTPTFA